MRREKIMMLVGGLAAVAIFFVLVRATPFLVRNNSGAPQPQPPAGSSGFSSNPGASPVPSNGFSPVSPRNRGATTATGAPTNAPPAVYNGHPVTSLDQVAAIVAATTSTPALKAPLLIIPAVADSEINLDPAGISTVAGFMAYFNEHSTKDIVFDAARLNSALKDSNGVVLLVPDLIDAALAENDFGKIRDSLIVQRDFANAEIAFVRGVRVAGAAAALAKQTIGTERLLVDVIDNAQGVAAGAMTQGDFVKSYASFKATLAGAHGTLLVQSGALGAAPRDNWFAQVLKKIGIMASAQSANVPFGGRINVPIPCTCSLGYWITVGPPKPALLFVPFPFVATPLFYQYKSLTPGVWWLGLYNPAAQIPCAQLPFCTPIGFGGSIVMAGTSGLP